MVAKRGPFKCPICSESLGSYEAVAAHTWAQHSISCPFCGYRLMSQQAMGQHYNTMHRFKCSGCNKEFVTESARDQHYRDNVAHCWTECLICDCRFRTQEAVVQHHNAEHRFKCPKCNHEFATRAAMDKHYEVNHRLVECPECGCEFKTEEAMNQHYDVVHRLVGCLECDRKFKTKEAMHQHLSAEHRFECPECHGKFTTKVAMAQHYDARHRFVCPYPSCSKYFTTEDAMNQHWEENHCLRCVHCPDTFATEGGRTQHYQKKHNLSCPECAKRFATAEGLLYHEESEHRTYSCPKCSAIFKIEGAMIQHFWSEHKSPLPPPLSHPYSQSLATESGDNAGPPLRATANIPALSQGIARPNQFFVPSLPNPQHHVRIGHPGIPTQARTAQAQPPVQKLQAPVKKTPLPAHVTPSPDTKTLTCEHCLALFPSLKDLKRHKITAHKWTCTKCPALPPFENRTTLQAHFDEVHAADAQSGADTDKWEKAAAPKKEYALSRLHSGEKRREGSDNTNPEDHAVTVHQPVIGNLSSKRTAPGIIQNEVALPASDNTVRKLREPLVELASGFLAPKTTSSSKDQTAGVYERNHLPPEGSTISILIEIDPEPRRGPDKTTYQIASDIPSPTTTASSIEPKKEHDIGSPSRSLELLDGNPLGKLQHRNVPPRGPKLGDRKSYTMSDDIVVVGRSGGEPNVQAQDRIGGVTPPVTKRSDSPTPTSLGLQDMGTDPNQGGPFRDPLQAAGSGLTTALPEISFKCKICFSDPTPNSNLTVTHCGHLFCYECIVTDVLKTSRCPVCQNALALYCLFKMDVAPWR